MPNKPNSLEDAAARRLRAQKLRQAKADRLRRQNLQQQEVAPEEEEEKEDIRDEEEREEDKKKNEEENEEENQEEGEEEGEGEGGEAGDEAKKAAENTAKTSETAAEGAGEAAGTAGGGAAAAGGGAAAGGAAAAGGEAVAAAAAPEALPIIAIVAAILMIGIIILVIVLLFIAGAAANEGINGNSAKIETDLTDPKQKQIVEDVKALSKTTVEDYEKNGYKIPGGTSEQPQSTPTAQSSPQLSTPQPETTPAITPAATPTTPPTTDTTDSYGQYPEGTTVLEFENPMDIYSLDHAHPKFGLPDIRLLKTLTYLVTSKDDGGAGHVHLKISKMFDVYDHVANSSQNPERQFNQGYQMDIEGNMEYEDNETAHRKGQAVDITEIDLVKQKCNCGDDIPVPVGWQDDMPDEAYKISGNQANSMGNSVQSMLLAGGNKSTEGIFDFAQGSFTGDNYDIISKNLGMQNILRDMGIDDLDFSSIDISEIMAKTGQKEIEDALAIKIKDPDLRANVTKTVIALWQQQAGLADGSLSSDDLRKMIKDTALRTAEQELELGSGSLEQKNTDDIFQKVILSAIGNEFGRPDLDLETFKTIRDKTSNKQLAINLNMDQDATKGIMDKGNDAQLADRMKELGARYLDKQFGIKDDPATPTVESLWSVYKKQASIDQVLSQCDKLKFLADRYKISDKTAENYQLYYNLFKGDEDAGNALLYQALGLKQLNQQFGLDTYDPKAKDPGVFFSFENILDGKKNAAEVMAHSKYAADMADRYHFSMDDIGTYFAKDATSEQKKASLQNMGANYLDYRFGLENTKVSFQDVFDNNKNLKYVLSKSKFATEFEEDYHLKKGTIADILDGKKLDGQKIDFKQIGAAYLDEQLGLSKVKNNFSSIVMDENPNKNKVTDILAQSDYVKFYEGLYHLPAGSIAKVFGAKTLDDKMVAGQDIGFGYLEQEWGLPQGTGLKLLKNETDINDVIREAKNEKIKEYMEGSGINYQDFIALTSGRVEQIDPNTGLRTLVPIDHEQKTEAAQRIGADVIGGQMDQIFEKNNIPLTAESAKQIYNEALDGNYKNMGDISVRYLALQNNIPLPMAQAAYEGFTNQNWEPAKNIGFSYFDNTIFKGMPAGTTEAVYNGITKGDWSQATQMGINYGFSLLDQQFGLPGGTSYGMYMLITTANPVFLVFAAAMYVINALGLNADYIMMGFAMFGIFGAILGALLGGKKCKETTDCYKPTAQQNTHQLISDLLEMPTEYGSGDRDLYARQIITYNEERDIIPFEEKGTTNGIKTSDIYGVDRMPNFGIMSSPDYIGHVHIGF